MDSIRKAAADGPENFGIAGQVVNAGLRELQPGVIRPSQNNLPLTWSLSAAMA
tara:strand:- start:3056 stop:3214 length:159 start_codon:yes stop_codon:yes gene_type:complete